MRWTEAGSAVALGCKNYWYFTMTGPLGHLGRYPAMMNNSSKIRRTWILPMIVAIVAALIYSATHYKIEEAARPHSISVTWVDDDIVSIRCARYSHESQFKSIISDYSIEFPAEYTGLRNGDEIIITELLSGFNSSRILHKFVAAEFTLPNGKTSRKIVEVTPKVLDDGKLEISLNRGENAG